MRLETDCRNQRRRAECIRGGTYIHIWLYGQQPVSDTYPSDMAVRVKCFKSLTALFQLCESTATDERSKPKQCVLFWLKQRSTHRSHILSINRWVKIESVESPTCASFSCLYPNEYRSPLISIFCWPTFSCKSFVNGNGFLFIFVSNHL